MLFSLLFVGLKNLSSPMKGATIVKITDINITPNRSSNNLLLVFIYTNLSFFNKSVIVITDIIPISHR